MSATYKDCPQDIRDLASHIVANFGVDGALLEGSIAAALDTERSKRQWQDISTAPMDVEFLAFVPAWKNGDYEIGSFIEVCSRWPDGAIVGSRTHSQYLSATHWMALPAVPNGVGGRA